MTNRTVAIILAAACAATEAKVAFERIVIDGNGPADIWLKAAGDLDGDGRPDLVAGGHRSGGLVWYRNPTWAKQTIAAEGRFGTDGEIVDIDGDRKPDVVALQDEGLFWYKSPGWTSHMVDKTRFHDVEVADLDGDGKPDMVARNQGAFSGRGDELHLYKQESPTLWSHRVLPIASNGEGLLLADVDGDRDMDIVIDRHWLENTGDLLSGKWPLREYGSSWTHPHTFVAAADLDKNGRLDIVLAPAEREGQTSRISWFESPRWVEHVVDPEVEAVHHFVGSADFNRDGWPDIATAEMFQGQKKEVCIYLNGGKGKKWTKHVIATTASHSMRIVDVDADGYPDLYGANWRSNVVELWRNLKARD